MYRVVTFIHLTSERVSYCQKMSAKTSEYQILGLFYLGLLEGRIINHFSFFSWPWPTYTLKVPGPISQNGDNYSNDASSPKKSWFQISVKSVKPFWHKKRWCILQLPIPYCVSLIMVTITSHIFINIFQTVHISAVKFDSGNEKNISFLLIPKSQKVW